MPTDNPETESDEVLSLDDRMDAILETMLAPKDGEVVEDESPAKVKKLYTTADTEEAETDSESDEDEEADAPVAKRKLKSGDEVTEEELENGYLRQADYTRKRMADAEVRKQLEDEKALVVQEREKYGVLLERLEKQTISGLGAEPDWEEMERNNPAEFAIEYARWQRGVKRLEAIEAEQGKIVHQRRTEEQKSFHEYLGQEQKLLMEAVPEWKDAAARDAELRELRDFGLKKGFTEKELDGIYDHRAVLLLREAMVLDRARARAATASSKTKVTPTTKTLKPGAAVPATKSGDRTRREAVSAHRRGGTVQSAAKVLEALGF